MVNNIKSALVSTFLMAIIAMAGYAVGVGNIFKLDTHALVNSGVMAFLTGLISLIKSWLTDYNGKFLGVVEIK